MFSKNLGVLSSKQNPKPLDFGFCFSQPGVPQLLRADSFYPLLFGSYYDDRPVARARDGVRAFRL